MGAKAHAGENASTRHCKLTVTLALRALRLRTISTTTTATTDTTAPPAPATIYMYGKGAPVDLVATLGLTRAVTDAVGDWVTEGAGMRGAFAAAKTEPAWWLRCDY
jgi:hypothetical protein